MRLDTVASSARRRDHSTLAVCLHHEGRDCDGDYTRAVCCSLPSPLAGSLCLCLCFCLRVPAVAAVRLSLSIGSRPAKLEQQLLPDFCKQDDARRAGAGAQRLCVYTAHRCTSLHITALLLLTNAHCTIHLRVQVRPGAGVLAIMRCTEDAEAHGWRNRNTLRTHLLARARTAHALALPVLGTATAWFFCWGPTILSGRKRSWVGKTVAE